MKICIVTLYKTFNSGSYLQAKALGIVLKKMGHRVSYLTVRYPFKAEIDFYVAFLKILLKSGPVPAIKHLISIRDFLVCRKSLNIVPNNDKTIDDTDCFVLGSDTIWNVEKESIAANADIFLGSRFRGKKVISYAASFSNTSIQDIQDFPGLKADINNLDSISVRDNYTLEILKQLTNNPVSLVCDPTLLLNKDDYEKMITEGIDEKYIFTYLFEPLDPKQEKRLSEFAKNNGLKIYQGASCKIRCCTHIAINSPYEFLKYMDHALYVITDTFHGTVFSTNLRKNFVVINRNKNKVNDYLRSVHFDERLVEDGEDFLPLFSKNIDYDIKSRYIEEYKERSFNFLKQALK